MSKTNAHGYQDFKLGSFSFRRDEYFAHISWTTRAGKPMSCLLYTSPSPRDS